MRIAIYARTANPAIDQPLHHANAERLAMLLATGRVVMIAAKQAQYVSDRQNYRKPLTIRSDEVGYDIEARRGRKLVWVPVDMTWQMRPSYGSLARHFRHSRAGLRFAPNTTTNPRDHHCP